MKKIIVVVVAGFCLMSWAPAEAGPGRGGVGGAGMSAQRGARCGQGQMGMRGQGRLGRARGRGAQGQFGPERRGQRCRTGGAQGGDMGPGRFARRRGP